MSEAPLMLSVSGLRGIVGTSLTPEVVARFGAAIAWFMRRRARRSGRGPRPIVAIARDGRSGGETWRLAASAGLMSAGCDVVDAGIAMTPSLAALVDEYALDAGVCITASHNPQPWNGMKLLLPDPRDRSRKRAGVAGMWPASACAPSAPLAHEVIDAFNARARGEHHGVSWDDLGFGGTIVGWAPDAGESHRALVRAALDEAGMLRLIRAAKFRVACDFVGASAGIATPDFVTEDLGASLHAIGEYRLDEGAGIFPHAPEPIRENLGALCALVKKSRTRLGFAQDPDADRLAIVDEKGRYIGEEHTLALAAESLLSMDEQGPRGRHRNGAKRRERVLVTNLSTSRMIDDVAARHGARVVRTPVGEANVVEAMKRERDAGRRVVLGGEGNGGVIWPRVAYVRDSLSAMGLVLSLIARRKQPLSEIVESMPRYAIEKRKVDLARKDDARPGVERIARRLKGPKARVDLQDGVRVDFIDRRAWVHVRASNTEPIMRLIAEAPTLAEARTILDEVEGIAASTGAKRARRT
jgi:phosphomannomutase